ncbi:hypothetical protein LMG24238_01192 [Paraburkholderia sediminicola]|uniref:Uncharacterized protein n=1 Tax=Paraburkholderia sediminicola TaxID=458836 RepID=A0A6J5A3F9_9BURK|nr:hypothetical protein [Paraburkholderia sediminicola]CAB3651919.1 hypothetical protein LMG24238_01192 [Paraburkholderia sediminicola]
MKISISRKHRELLKSGSAAVIPRLQHAPAPQRFLAQRARHSPFTST